MTKITELEENELMIARKELIHKAREIERLIAELRIANKELDFQKEERGSGRPS